MQPARINASIWAAAVLLGLVGLYGPDSASAADVGSPTAARFRGGELDSAAPGPEATPGGTVVLRGTRPSNPAFAQPGFDARGAGYGSSAESTVFPDAGVDSSLDFSGLDPPAGGALLPQ